ncbi:hypothetical protein QBC43DRAFT_226795 [Cladorrhinum sp. PSN259]|nr:hypothetical protein QBC43DRAFT_226795 [Cladorrhinum sp. PSN259]
MGQQPPPPPPHGDNPKTTSGGLPKGRYDVFIIPDHSAGAGFLYLPSLQPQMNSFLAGLGVALVAIILGINAAPIMYQILVLLGNTGNASTTLVWLLMLVVSFLFGMVLGENKAAKKKKSERGSGDRWNDARSEWYTPPPQNPSHGPTPNQAPPNPPPPPPHSQPETPRDGGGSHESWQEQPRPPPQPQPKANPRPETELKPQPPPEPQVKSQPRPETPPQPPQPPQPKQAPPPPSPQPPPSPPKVDPYKGAWEKAREETRKREEERKAREAEAKRKEDAARRLRELRERDAKEREKREMEARERESRERFRQEQEAREKARLERELREKVDRELAQKEKELRERLEKEARQREALERERLARESKEREEARRKEEERIKAFKERQEAREREAKEAKERKEPEEARNAEEERVAAETAERSRKAYAFSGGEKFSMWPNGRPPSPPTPSEASYVPPPTPKHASPGPAPSPTKPAFTPSAAKSTTSIPKPSPKPTPPKQAQSSTGVADEYSYRPYDTPKKARKKSVSDFSESSWAPSATSTSRTSPPPSMREPYTTNDPQKIVLKGVYAYLNEFSKTPAQQLVSGVGSVTDGLILRITSAGLFVDDDVRGVAQREWDVKAWTVKQVEVWCPQHAVTASASNTPGAMPTNHPFFKTMPRSSRMAERGATKLLLGEEALEYISDFSRVCKETCRRGLASSASAAGTDSDGKTGVWKKQGLHLIRATIRDQEGKRYLFVIGEEEGWKIAAGISALRGSSQVRALGVAGLSTLESKTIFEQLGWA